MIADKIRIKKYQKPKVEQWCQALEIIESRFIEDAINFYIRHLEGKETITPIILTATATEKPKNKVVEVQTDDPEEFDGGIDL